MTKVKLLSKSEYAKAKGWHHSYITKLSKKGMLVEVDGKIDVLATDKRLREAQDPARDHVRKQIKGNGKVKAKRKNKRQDQSPGELSYHQARTERERIKAKREQAEYDLFIGKLVDSEEVRISAFNRGRILRDNILNVPERIAPILAAETDPRKVHQILFKELRSALEEESNANKC